MILTAECGTVSVVGVRVRVDEVLLNGCTRDFEMIIISSLQLIILLCI